MSIFSFLKSNPSSIQSLNAADFKAILADNNVQLIDVRTAEEYAQGTIEKARLINVLSADFEQKVEELDKDLPVAVFCRSGVRSMSAATLLLQKGFPAVYNLKGGIICWR